MHFHSLLLLFARAHPRVIEDIDAEIERFLKDPEQRTKKTFENIGLLLVYSLVSEKYSFKDIVPAYFEEQLDRQVFWILLKVPELDDPKSNRNVTLDVHRVEISFTSQIVGYLLVSFFHDYRKVLRSHFKSWPAMLEHVE